MPNSAPGRRTILTAVLFAGAINLAYFGVEFAVAHHIGSVSLLADSVDFLEDTALNALVAMALFMRARLRAEIGRILAVFLLLPAAATVVMAWHKIHAPSAPVPHLLSITAAGAMLVNLASALALARVRHHGGSLTRAAFLSSRNDVLANIAIILTAGITMLVRNGWPDIVTGIGIGLLNLDAAHDVWTRATREKTGSRKSGEANTFPNAG